MRCVARGCERGPNAEGVDGCTILQELGDLEFVDIAGSEYLDVFPSHAIEFAAHPPAVSCKISAIETHASGLPAHRDYFLYCISNVVSIEQQDRIIRKSLEEMAEGFGFIFVGHYPGMRLRTVGIHTEELTGEHIRCAHTSTDRSCTSGEQTGLAAVSAPCAELDDLAALGSTNHARSLARDHCLVADGREQISLHNLTFDDWSHNSQDGLAGKNERAFGYGPNVAGESEFRKVIEELVADVAEDGMAAQERDFFWLEMNVLEEFQRLLEPRRNEIVALLRKVTDEKLECGASVEASLQVARRHREFIEIGEQA